MSTEEHVNLAFCWYEPDEWLKIKKVAADAEKQDDTYEEWKANANDAIRNIRATGRNVVKIAMKAEEFLAWCKENNHENNSESRSKYAAKKLEERNRET